MHWNYSFAVIMAAMGVLFLVSIGLALFFSKRRDKRAKRAALLTAALAGSLVVIRIVCKDIALALILHQGRMKDVPPFRCVLAGVPSCT